MACIDKRHSAELQEAINSMYSWYAQAKICLAYLADVPTDDEVDGEDSKFISSRWYKGFLPMYLQARANTTGR